MLDTYKFKATFFCIGNNVEKYPDIYSEILKRGHKTANHTFSHLNGFKSSNKFYFDNIEKCSELVNSQCFRPPHGRIKYSQIDFISKKFKIIMWSLLAEDWNKNLNIDRKITNLIKHTQTGDIIVFHDSLKALENIKLLLPAYFEFLSKNNFKSKLFE